MMDTYLDDRYVTYMQTGLKVIRHVQMVHNHNVFLMLHCQRYENQIWYDRMLVFTEELLKLFNSYKNL